MRLLLDTHAFLWFVSEDGRLSRRARRAIANPRNDRWLSLASVWEMAIKVSQGKLRLNVTLDALLESEATRNGITLLDIRREHVVGVASLPRHHGDPFDRLIVCQALFDELKLVSADENLDVYGLSRLW